MYQSEPKGGLTTRSGYGPMLVKMVDRLPIERGNTTMIATYLPWLLSAITIWMTLMAGNKHPQAWLIGLGNQALWLLWICVVGAWGLLPMNIALWIVYARNHAKWRAAHA